MSWNPAAATRAYYRGEDYHGESPFPEPIMVERGRDYERDLRWRRSRLPWRRRKAHEACLHLIRVRERDLYGLDGPPPPKAARAECPCTDGPCDGCVEHTRLGGPRRFMRVAPRTPELPTGPDPSLVQYVARI